MNAPLHTLATTLTLENAFYSYSKLRSLLYTFEGLLIPATELFATGSRPRLPLDDAELFKASREALDQLLKEDATNIASGLYPISVLRPGSPWQHIKRVPRLFLDGWASARKREAHSPKEFSKEARELLEDKPEYYRRTFHFQRDGYLSEHSAKLYDHQVDVLFAGAGDAMRRLILRPFKEHFGFSEGDGLTFLELGSGTGRATWFMRLAFPKAKIVSVDLSAPYIKEAQKLLSKFSRHDFFEGDATHLPFQDGHFDGVYSVFLLHELPQEERAKVVKEALRVLKPGGILGLVDSLQKGDVPALDPALELFPQRYHEPFYKNYIQQNLETHLKALRMKDVDSHFGFYSKVVYGTKTAE